MPLTLFFGLVFWSMFFVILTPKAEAVTIADQTQNWGNQLKVWQAIQELGDNLSGTAQNFTFRVSTNQPNLIQFDYTASNTKIYDKTNNTVAIPFGCVPNSSNSLAGLTFQTEDIPSGYQDVTIDFSCHNYSFIPGHRYLINITNANSGNAVAGKILFAAAAYGPGGEQTVDRFIGGGVRYAFDNGFCNATTYTWNSQTNKSGCNIFSSPKDDLYFVLNNNAPPPPPPKLPVIFIPGIGGSELKTNQDIFWVDQDDGHGGIYSHAYSAQEKVWVNQDEASKLGDDDYFDVLRLKKDGQTAEADLSLTGDLTSAGYGDIDSFFTEMEYIKGTNFFIFPYDWRKDVRENKDSLDNLIEQAKTSSGQSQVNLVVHSIGGLIARFYISDSSKATKVNKLIELGVPHLGAVESLKTVRYGSWLGYDFRLFTLGIPPSETRDGAQNMASMFQLLPSIKYYDFYNNSDNNHLYPYRDDRDIDNNKEIGPLNFSQTKNLLSNMGHNMAVFSLGEQFHNFLDPILNLNYGAKIYEIVGTAQPTLGQIHETWWITWPVNLIPKTDEIYINGDSTVPLYSASLKNESLDISGAEKIYYVEQKHSDLVSQSGIAMQTVKSILNDDNSLPVEVKDQKITLEGYQLSLDDGELDLYDDQNRHCGLNDNGELEENIPEVSCTTSGNTKHAFVKKKSSKVKIKATRKKAKTSSKKVTLRSRTYKQDKISKTTLYKDIPLNQTAKVEFTLDPAEDSTPSLFFYADETKEDSITIASTSEVSGDTASDQTPPATSIQISGTKNSSGIYDGPVTITLTGHDADSGILRIEYSLDNGQTVQTYEEPFTISSAGKTTIQIKSIDKLGNEEIPQTITIEIVVPPSPTPASSTGSSTTEASSSDNSTTDATSGTASISTQSLDSPSSSPDILGLTFENPSHISDQINVEKIVDKILEEQKNPKPGSILDKSPEEILGGLLIISGGIVTLASVGLLATFHTSGLSFVKPFPK